MSSSRILVVLFVTGLHLLIFSPNLVDCVSLEIKDHQKEFTFQAGMKSEIEFVLNGTCRCETTVYLHMKSISGETKPICKFVLSENCVTHYSNCNCAAAVVDSRHGYKMWRTFHPQDSGDWVFEVWGANVQKIISIRVEGNGTTEDNLFSDGSYDSFFVLQSKGFVLFSMCFNVVCTITIAVVVVTFIVRRQRKFSRSRQINDAGDERLYANNVTLNSELKSHQAGGQTPEEYLVPFSRSNVYVMSCGKETALDEMTTFQLQVTGRRENSAWEEQGEYINLAQELPPPPPPPPPPVQPPPPSPPPPASAQEDHQPMAPIGQALLPPPPPPPPLP